MGTRVLDFVVRVGQRVMTLEAKYSIPRGGSEAMDRLAAQVTEGLAAGEGQLVLWSMRPATAQQLEHLRTALGASYYKIVVVDGVEGLCLWMQQYFQYFAGG